MPKVCIANCIRSALDFICFHHHITYRSQKRSSLSFPQNSSVIARDKGLQLPRPCWCGPLGLLGCYRSPSSSKEYMSTHLPRLLIKFHHPLILTDVLPSLPIRRFPIPNDNLPVRFHFDARSALVDKKRDEKDVLDGLAE